YHDCGGGAVGGGGAGRAAVDGRRGAEAGARRRLGAGGPAAVANRGVVPGGLQRVASVGEVPGQCQGGVHGDRRSPRAVVPVRLGLASARHQPFSFWDAAGSRLVDARMPGLADRVRALPALLHSAEDWADRLLAELARGYLAVSAWRRRDMLPDDALAELRVLLGWPRRVDEILERGERLSDRWVVMGLAQETDGRLQSQRTW